MEVSLRECPACGAVVMGDEQACNACGKALPVAEPAPGAGRGAAPRVEDVCPRCGVKVPRGVLRCRDCGAYMSSDVEAAAVARLGGRALGAAFPAAGSSFAEVADDADFDLNPGMDMLDPAMRAMVEGPTTVTHGPVSSEMSEDDF